MSQTNNLPHLSTGNNNSSNQNEITFEKKDQFSPKLPNNNISRNVNIVSLEQFEMFKDFNTIQMKSLDNKVNDVMSYYMSLMKEHTNIMDKFLKMYENNSDLLKTVHALEKKVIVLEEKISNNSQIPTIQSPYPTTFNFDNLPQNYYMDLENNNESDNDDNDVDDVVNYNKKKNKRNRNRRNRRNKKKLNTKINNQINENSKSQNSENIDTKTNNILSPWTPEELASLTNKPLDTGIIISFDTMGMDSLSSSSFGSFDQIISGISKKMTESKNKSQEKENDDIDDDVQEEFDEEDNNRKIEDLGVQIKSIDDLITLGNMYIDLKNVNNKNDNDKNNKSSKDKKESLNDLQSKVINILKKLGISDKLSISKMIDNKNIEKKTNTDKPTKKKISRLYELNGRYYPINLQTVHNLVKPLTKLKNMIGLTKVKEAILDMILYYLQMFEVQNNNMLHTVIEGPPGVGKTQLGRILAETYAAMGIIPTNKFKLVKRTDLIGEYLGHTAHKTKKAIEEADGGVLFIDEAYSLGAQDGGDSFSKEAIDTLNQCLSEKKRKLIVIIAGYPDELEKSFFSYNPGLHRRFPFRFKIDGYTPEEMSKIFAKKVNDIQWKLQSDDSEIKSNIKLINVVNLPQTEKLTTTTTDNTINLSTKSNSKSDKSSFLTENQIVEFFKENKDYFPNFGGDIENLLVQCKFCHSRRVIGQSTNTRCIITKDDLTKGFERYKLNRSKDIDRNKVNKELFNLMVI